MADDIPTFGAPRGEDPDITPKEAPAGAVPAAAGSPLDFLREEASRQVTGKTVTLVTKERPGWSIRYRADVELPQFNKWRKQCADRTQPDGIDELKIACIVLANQCDSFVRNGEDFLDGDGNPITFTSPDLHASFGVGRAVDAVKAWYGIDGHILSDSQEVMMASGFGDEAEREDPTPGSSRP